MSGLKYERLLFVQTESNQQSITLNPILFTCLIHTCVYITQITLRTICPDIYSCNRKDSISKLRLQNAQSQRFSIISPYGNIPISQSARFHNSTLHSSRTRTSLASYQSDASTARSTYSRSSRHSTTTRPSTSASSRRSSKAPQTVHNRYPHEVDDYSHNNSSGGSPDHYTDHLHPEEDEQDSPIHTPDTEQQTTDEHLDQIGSHGGHGREQHEHPDGRPPSDSVGDAESEALVEEERQREEFERTQRELRDKREKELRMSVFKCELLDSLLLANTEQDEVCSHTPPIFIFSSFLSG